MAKKNSSKTATQESISKSQPRIQTFKQWTGINLAQQPLDGEITTQLQPNKFQGKAQSDSQPTYLAAQNNLVCCSNGSVETRRQPIQLNTAPEGFLLTGVSTCHDNYVYVVAKKDNVEYLFRFALPTLKQNYTPKDGELPWTLNEWEQITYTDNNSPQVDPTTRTFTSFCVFSSKLIVLARVTKDGVEHGEMFDGNLDTITTSGVSNAKEVPNPQSYSGNEYALYNNLNVTRSGIDAGEVSVLTFTAVWVNKYGTTLQTGPYPSSGSNNNTVHCAIGPAEFTSYKHVNLSGNIPAGYGITGVDIYCKQNEQTDNIFCGHVNITGNSTTWSFAWLGAMMDTSQWTQSSLTIPTLNTTKGVDACFADNYDGRLYFYGGNEKYRLYIGGNPGSELSVATGLGGAFVDIEPGSGQEVRKVLKFKTYNGATVITLLTYHPNTNKGARYNLIETTITVTNEYQASGYTTEKVDSILGCSSYYGADTFLDGIYSINRYGLAYTTKQQENSNALKMTYCSDNIAIAFDSLLGAGVGQSRLLCIKDVIYVLLVDPIASQSDPSGGFKPYDMIMDDYIWCYDSGLKAWYTITLKYSGLAGEENVILNDNVKHMIHIDSESFWEGLGVIKENGVFLFPTSGDNYEFYYNNNNVPVNNVPTSETLFCTHELSGRVPITNFLNVNQLQINFDYICAPHGLDIWVEGVDYYGRQFTISKTVTFPKLQRYTEVFMRIDKYVESLRLFIKGKADYRLTHLNMKAFQKQNRIGSQFGFDARSIYKGHHSDTIKSDHVPHTYHDIKDMLLS